MDKEIVETPYTKGWLDHQEDDSQAQGVEYFNFVMKHVF